MKKVLSILIASIITMNIMAQQKIVQAVSNSESLLWNSPISMTTYSSARYGAATTYCRCETAAS